MIVWPSSEDYNITILIFIFFCLWGLLLGSFTTAIIYRVPKNISYIKTDNSAARSNCTDCGHILSFIDLIPLFSWCFNGGKCRYCKKAISAFYPLTETIIMVLSLSLLMIIDDYRLAAIWAFNLPFLYASIYLYFRHKKLFFKLFGHWFIVFVISLCLTYFLRI